MTVRLLQIQATGTVWSIEYRSEKNLDQLIKKTLKEFEEEFSRFLDSSALSELSDKKSLKNPSLEMQDILKACLKYYDLTDGRFDPRVGGLLESRGYGRHNTSPSTLNPLPLSSSLIVTPAHITLTDSSRLDLGGIGKGWLADSLATRLKDRGSRDIVVNAGGDIRVIADRPIELYLEHPTEPETYLGKVLIQDGALASTSPHKRKWKQGAQTHTHLVSLPSTLSPSPCSSWDAIFTLAPTTTLADVATKSLFSLTDELEIIAAAKKLDVDFFCYKLESDQALLSPGFSRLNLD
jgi:FAD:protein FMN transferase